jgi:ADP-ribose pyrophosphatase
MAEQSRPVGKAQFRVTGESEVARAGFLRIVDRRVEGEIDGEAEAFTRVVIEHPGAVVVVPVTMDGRAVLVRQYRAATDSELLEVPAGKRDVDGEAPEETARRELAEETGLRAGRLVKLAEFWNTPGFCTEYTHLYAALDLGDVGERAAVRAEEAAMTVESIALDDVDRLIANREIVDAKSIIGLLLARALVAGRFDGMTA